jgi:NAD(P)H dehydrogenase (quinone)
MTTIAVTGTTGKVGSRVARRLAERGAEQLLVGRDPGRMPSLTGAERRGPAAYAERDGMAAALTGADTLFLVSASLSGRRLEEHASAVDAALSAGVTRVVYLSLMGAAPDATYVNARDHGETEAHLRGLGIRWTIIRPGFYASMLPGLADADGEIRAPAGDGRVSAVTHEDIADACVGVLLDETGQYDGQVLEVTGPEALSLDDVARRLARWTGRPHSYVRENLDEGLDWRRRLDDATEDQVQAWLSWHLAIARGEVDAVTDVVERVAGHPARPVEDAWGSEEPQARLR